MAISFKHLFQSGKGDPADTTLVRPSNWNAEHVLTMAANTLLGAITAGNAVEIPCTTQGRAILAASDLAALLTALGAGMFTTGDLKPTLKTVADTGWRMFDDGTIGNASSGATLASSTTEALFAVIWAISISWAPIYTSGGVVSTRGANAAADYAANKRLALPRALGRALGVAGAGSGLTSRALGEYVGTETHALVLAELAAHTHTGNTNVDGSHSHTVPHGVGPTYTVGGGTPQPLYESTGTNITTSIETHSHAFTTGSTGSGTAHNNVQPTFFANMMVKL